MINAVTQQLDPHVCICVSAGTEYELTCVLVTNLLAGLSGPLATVVPDPLCGRIGLIVEG